MFGAPARDLDLDARIERETRLRAVAPLAVGGRWVELRAGSGPAADDPSPEGATAIVGDFADPAEVERLRETAGAGALITVFDTLEHLPVFAPLVEVLVELAAQHGATVVLSVPNHDVLAAPSATHGTIWGEGALAELRSLLPAEHVIIHQVALRGSALIPQGAVGERETTVRLGDAATPVAWLVAFGARADDLGEVLAVAQADMATQRALQRELQAELEVLRARLA